MTVKTAVINIIGAVQTRKQLQQKPSLVAATTTEIEK